MKTKKLLTTTTLLAVCIITSALTAYAQGGKGRLIKNAVEDTKNLLKAPPRNYRGTIQRFVFPAATAATIRKGISEGRLERTVSDEVLQHSTIPAPIILGHTPREISHSLQLMVASIPLEKEVLLSNAAEERFYAPEITAARDLHTLINEIHVLDEEETVAIASAIVKDIKNHTLQTYLFNSLKNHDVYMLDTDLTEYFGLTKPVEIASFNYMVRHPHQQTLTMRRLLNNPLVDEELKAPLRDFLSKSRISPNDYPLFQRAIADIHTQYQERMAAARESDLIQTQVMYYAKLVDRLGDFIAKNGRIPKWNTNNSQEMQLLDEIEWVKINESHNQFEPLASYQKALNLVLDSAAPAYLTREETVALFEEFVKTTHRLYPRSLRDTFKEGEIPFPREEELWDNLSYWRVKDTSIGSDLSAAYRKYPTP